MIQSQHKGTLMVSLLPIYKQFYRFRIKHKKYTFWDRKQGHSIRFSSICAQLYEKEYLQRYCFTIFWRAGWAGERLPAPREHPREHRFRCPFVRGWIAKGVRGDLAARSALFLAMFSANGRRRQGERRPCCAQCGRPLPSFRSWSVSKNARFLSHIKFFCFKITNTQYTCVH